MTQKEIVEFEEANTGVIRLYLEGTFYKAHERSAFAFCTRIKDYRVLRKESKTLGNAMPRRWSRQLSVLQRKATGPVPAECD